MLWRALLAAIAISCTFPREINAQLHDLDPTRLVQIKDVVCVLLLGGIQKEDLDADTLDKLRRHNVNIHDMNNESMRQGCLLKSLLDIDYKNQETEMKENQNDTSVIPLKKPNYTEGFNVMDVQTSKITIPENNHIDTNLRRQTQEYKPQTFIVTAQTNTIDNKQNITQDKEENKDLTTVYLKNQSLENVLKFWSKFTRKAEPMTEATITTPYTIIETTTPNIIHENKGYVHSKETDYVSRIIAEYLATQTVPTTTQIATTKMEEIDLISSKIKELLSQNSKNEIDPMNILLSLQNTVLLKPKTDVVNPMVALETKKDISNKNTRRFSDISEFTRLIQMKNEVTSEKTQHVPDQVTLNDNFVNTIRDQVTHINFKPSSFDKLRDPKQESLAMTIYEGVDQKQRALKYLDDMLRLHKELNTNPPIFTTTTRKPLITYEEQEILERLKHFQYKTEESNTVRDTSPVANFVKEPVNVVSSDVIQAIAEKVKEIVIKDIKKEITTEAVSSPATTASTASTTVSTTTASVATTPSTIASTIVTTTTETPTTAKKEANERNQVLDTLIKMFKEFNSIKDTTKAAAALKTTLVEAPTTIRSLPSSSLYLSPISPFKPYNLGPTVSNIEPLKAKPYNKLVPIPIIQTDRGIQEVPYIPQTNFYKQLEYRPPPVMFQTNSAEIRPLAVEVHKQSVINQEILVTTQNPYEKQKGEELDRQSKQRFEKFAEILGKRDESNRLKDELSFDDLTMKLRIAENAKNDYKESLKERIQKLKEKLKLAQDRKDKTSELIRPQDSDHRASSSLVEASLHSEVNHDRSEDTIYRDTLNRLLNNNIHEFYKHTRPDKQYRPVDLNHRAVLNRPSLDSETRNRPRDRDRLNKDVLSQLTDSDRQELINSLLKYTAPDAVRRPVVKHENRYSEVFPRLDNTRQRPMYRGPKFHEKLERLDWSGSNYKPLGKMTTENCCDIIAARQQKPLAKMKKRSKYDDSHFRNFLKSQQKVTDMLERILASKNKSGPRSVETT
ncbi:uncharacterized protein LOC142981037 [Anticarsia gemmatalis]|uniref:uncharacterized protein LOC142981037 n=1 Tax=Anticarsia gemmatalis TaxID=129554 RepID=UPI003F76B36F